MRYLILFLMGACLSISAEASTKPSKNIDLCKSAAHASERKYNIPRNLLRAISLTESGRWVKEDKANIAWPWTVASGKAGEFFPTKSEAIRHVRDLQAQGVTNIDVGCMQINLRYHPEAFKNLDDAFDPYLNTNYAGDFLARLFKETKSWSAAAGRYHSADPDRGLYYKEKVLGFWQYANTEEPQDQQYRENSYRVAQIDTQRTTLLNNNFRKRLANQRQAVQRVDEMSAQISQWRDSRRLSNSTQVNAAKNAALRAQKEKKGLLTQTTTTYRGLGQQRDFSKRRSAQLDRWRRTVAHPDYIEASTQSQPQSLLEN